ncbi:MAG TPA: hypothetical protein VGR00_13250, partial [Thermoanaerobaculia bacterium]|nr:hypothetical protein [Thermoanaerobaculia bacterium]
RRETYSEPTVAVGPEGALWVTVSLVKEVRCYGPDGALRETLKGEAATPPFETPMGIGLDRAGSRIVVCDLEGHLVTISRATR